MNDVDFTGIPQGTFKFLKGLTANNNKAWFESHRTDFDEYFMAPARALVGALGPRLKKISPKVQFEPKVNGSIFRINRDIRFARDKRPYKTNLDLWFWHGERGGWNAPGFYVRIAPDSAGVGVGMHMFPKPQLDAYRKAAVDPKKGRALAKAIADVSAAGYAVHGATRKTVPRGFAPGTERAGLLLHESLWTEFTGPPKSAATAAFVDACAEHAAAMWPIGKWLMAEVASTT